MNEPVEKEDTKKLGKAFRMLKWISVTPGVDKETLAKLLDISTRGVYRYIKDLRQIGVPIKTHRNAGYSLESTDILGAIKWSMEEPEEVILSALFLG